jgi:hypothetical protein
LDYAQRFEWDALPVTAGTYERGPTSRARTNERFKDRGFHPSDAWLDDLPVLLESAGALRAAAAVGEPMAADAPPRVEALEALAAEHPEWFYPAYLTAERYRLGGEAQAAERWMAESFARAEAALVLPAASGAAVALGFDEVNEDGNTLDRSLVLVYPAPLAEADGRAYLPAHKAMIRIADPDVPFAPPPRPDAPSWLTWPGRVGVLPPAGGGLSGVAGSGGIRCPIRRFACGSAAGFRWT